MTLATHQPEGVLPGAWAAERSAQVKEETAQRAGDTDGNIYPTAIGSLQLWRARVECPLHWYTCVPTKLQDAGRCGALLREVKKEPTQWAGDTDGAECHIALCPEVPSLGSRLAAHQSHSRPKTQWLLTLRCRLTEFTPAHPIRVFEPRPII